MRLTSRSRKYSSRASFRAGASSLKERDGEKLGRRNSFSNVITDPVWFDLVDKVTLEDFDRLDKFFGEFGGDLPTLLAHLLHAKEAVPPEQMLITMDGVLFCVGVSFSPQQFCETVLEMYKQTISEEGWIPFHIKGDFRCTSRRYFLAYMVFRWLTQWKGISVVNKDKGIRQLVLDLVNEMENDFGFSISRASSEEKKESDEPVHEPDVSSVSSPSSTSSRESASSSSCSLEANDPPLNMSRIGMKQLICEFEEALYRPEKKNSYEEMSKLDDRLLISLDRNAMQMDSNQFYSTTSRRASNLGRSGTTMRRAETHRPRSISTTDFDDEGDEEGKKGSKTKEKDAEDDEEEVLKVIKESRKPRLSDLASFRRKSFSRIRSPKSSTSSPLPFGTGESADTFVTGGEKTDKPMFITGRRRSSHRRAHSSLNQATFSLQSFLHQQTTNGLNPADDSGDDDNNATEAAAATGKEEENREEDEFATKRKSHRRASSQALGNFKSEPTLFAQQTSPTSKGTPSSKQLFDMPPEFVARQITLYMHEKLYGRIELLEFNRLAQDGEYGHNTLRLIRFFDVVSSWVETEVLSFSRKSASGRGKILVYFLKMAQCAREMNNYHFLFALVAGLGQPTLTWVWDLASPKHVQQFKDLQRVVSPRHNYIVYRADLSKCNGKAGRIPFLGVILKDLSIVTNDSKTLSLMSGWKCFKYACEFIGGLLHAPYHKNGILDPKFADLFVSALVGTCTNSAIKNEMSSICKANFHSRNKVFRVVTFLKRQASFS